MRLAVAIIAALLLAGCQPTERVRAVAADELIVRGHWIELHGVDAPREKGAACKAEEDAASIARQRLAQIAAGAASLDFRKTGMACPLWVRCDGFVTADGVDLSERMIEEGLLFPKASTPYDWCAAARRILNAS